MMKFFFIFLISNLIFSFEFYLEPKMQSLSFAKERNFLVESWESGHPNYELPKYANFQKDDSFVLAVGLKHSYKLENNYSISVGVEKTGSSKVDLNDLYINLIKQMESSSMNIFLAISGGSIEGPSHYYNYWYSNIDNLYSRSYTSHNNLNGIILGLSYNMELINKKYYSQNIKIYSELNVFEDNRYINLGVSSEVQLGIIKYLKEEFLKPQTSIL